MFIKMTIQPTKEPAHKYSEQLYLEEPKTGNDPNVVQYVNG